jgi:hypothetical protein
MKNTANAEFPSFHFVEYYSFLQTNKMRQRNLMILKVDALLSRRLFSIQLMMPIQIDN